MSTIPARLLERLDRSRGALMFMARTDQVRPGYARSGRLDAPVGWTGFSGADCEAHLSGLARVLADLGIERGVPLALLAETSLAWVGVDLATLALGGITVGLYPSLTGEQVAWQVAHAEARVLVVQNQAQYDKIRPFLDRMPSVRHVVSLTEVAGVPELTPADPDVDFLRDRAARVQPDDTATFVYTSGTTGNPKGAVLTHRHLVVTADLSQAALPLGPEDRSLIFLPLAHVLQRFALYQGLFYGVTGTYVPSLADLPAVLPIARPTVLATVPRMLEKIKAGAEARAVERGPRAARIFAWALDVGHAAAHARRSTGSLPWSLAAQHWLADRLVLSRIRERLGGSLRVIISGGAALSPSVCAWFDAVGIPVREAWGLTETTGPATLVRPAEYRPGYVGRPLDGVGLRLAEDGEVLVRGPNVFAGYYKDEAATAACLDAEGWFRTGDIGEIDQEGYLRIVDRKKELIVTAGGKNIPPVNLEKKLEGGLLGQAVVVGSERPYLVALLAADPDALSALAQERGWTGDFAALSARPEVRAAFEERVAALNAVVAPFESIKRFAVLPAPLTEATGELTPTLKLKRRVILEKYRDLVDSLYAGAGDA